MNDDSPFVAGFSLDEKIGYYAGFARWMKVDPSQGCFQAAGLELISYRMVKLKDQPVPVQPADIT
jgi:hypothetical protein